MNNTAANTGITWKVTGNQPIAHVHISADMTFAELRELGRLIYSVLAEMEWSAATLLEVGSQSRGHRVMHLMRKAEYEANHDAAALCGKPGPWDLVYVLARTGRGGICKKCLAMQELAVSLDPVEQESEVEHGSK